MILRTLTLSAAALVAADAAIAHAQEAATGHAAEHGAHSAHSGHGGAHAGHGGAEAQAPAPRGALGPYPLAREASGTGWQPDAAPSHAPHGAHAGRHAAAAPAGPRWSRMAHLDLTLAHSAQSGPRGDDKTFLAGMAMASARRDGLAGDVVQFRGMLSPDPFMGEEGFPQLLASGETADGREPLIDRQHPHDLFIELSASYSRPIGDRASAFVYAGLPGEPAFGPPPFMHRASTGGSPEAPITHHWLDSTHITFGVVTAGLVLGDVKLEASRFRGREPDENRFDIETGELDSTALRASWNPTPNLSLQASWADVVSPEQLAPGEDQTKWSASALYARPLGDAGSLAAIFAFGRRTPDDGDGE
jgi:hypothetical protein